MAMVRKFVGYSIVKTDCPFNFTMGKDTGKLIVPDGVPASSKLRYVERQNFSDGTFKDSDWITLKVGDLISS